MSDGSRVFDLIAALGPPQVPQDPGETPTGARDVDLALPDSWRDFIRQHSVDGATEPSRAAAIQVGGRVAIVVNLETLLGQSGPEPTPGERQDVNLVAINGKPVRDPVSGRMPVSINSGGSSVGISPSLPLYVDAEIGSGRGTAAATPLFVQVTNPSTGGGGLVPGPSKQFVRNATHLSGSNWPLKANQNQAWASGQRSGFARIVVTGIRLEASTQTWVQELEDSYIEITFGFSNYGSDALGLAVFSAPDKYTSSFTGPCSYPLYAKTAWVPIVQTAAMDWSANAWSGADTAAVPENKGSLAVIGRIETMIPASSLESEKNEAPESPVTDDLESTGPTPLRKSAPRRRDAKGRFSRQTEE